MTSLRVVAMGLAIAAVHACTRQAARTEAAAGDIDINAFTATRTVLVRVQNNYPTRVHVFTVIGNNTTEIVDLETDGVHTVALDPRLFPGTSFSLEIVPATGRSKRIGPFHLSRGQTANLIIAPDLDSSRVQIRPTTSTTQ